MSTIKALGVPKIKALGLNNLQGVENPLQKSLNIKYVSFSKDKENINFIFVVATKNLKSGKAKIHIDEEEVGKSEPVTSGFVQIMANGTTKVNHTFPISTLENLTNSYFEGEFEFNATIECDGLSAETKGFKLKISKEKSLVGKTCFCNRNLTTEELKNTIIELRKREIYIENGRLIRDIKGNPVLKNGKKQFADITMYDELQENLFNLDYPEKLNYSDANFSKFADALNKVFKDYDISTCIRKIHFLAQCYHETQRFTITYEKNPNSNVSGGSFYRGRGLIQLTHDYNYEKLKKALKINSTLNEFVPRVAKEIDLACQASAYFWKNIGAKTGNINQYADKDDVLTVSREINGYVSIPNGLNDRKLFTNILKKVMKYDQCKSKK